MKNFYDTICDTKCVHVSVQHIWSMQSYLIKNINRDKCMKINSNIHNYPWNLEFNFYLFRSNLGQYCNWFPVHHVHKGTVTEREQLSWEPCHDVADWQATTKLFFSNTQCYYSLAKCASYGCLAFFFSNFYEMLKGNLLSTLSDWTSLLTICHLERKFIMVRLMRVAVQTATSSGWISH